MKQKILNKILSYLANAVTEDSFMQVLMKKDLKQTKGYAIMVGGKVLSVPETKELVAEARTIKKFKLWQMMKDSQKWTANDLIQNKSVKIEDLHFPKAVLYNIDVWEKKINNIANIHFDK